MVTTLRLLPSQLLRNLARVSAITFGLCAGATGTAGKPRGSPKVTYVSRRISVATYGMSLGKRRSLQRSSLIDARSVIVEALQSGNECWSSTSRMSTIGSRSQRT